MGFVGNIKDANYVFDKEDKTAIPDLVTKLLDEEYDVEDVTLRNDKREVKLKKGRKGISVRFNDYSEEGNSREAFRQTMDLLDSR